MENNKLTPKQRAKIYLKAAQKITHHNVCYLLGDLIKYPYEYGKGEEFSKIFPEFFMFSPGHNGDWWGEDYSKEGWRKPRIIALLLSYQMALNATE